MTDQAWAQAGRILRVDLGAVSLAVEDSRPYLEPWLGGRGLNSALLFQESRRGLTWRDPEASSYLGAGLLVGTPAYAACRTDISGFNVFNNGKGSANVGGFFGAQLKYSGFDNLVLTGRSPEPVYLFLNDGRAELRPADFLWGRGVVESERLLRERHGPGVKCALIGPAGENLVQGSGVIVDTAKAAAGCGVGCVWGWKKLKGVVVGGGQSLRLKDPERFLAVVARTREQLLAHPGALAMRQSLADAYANPDHGSWSVLAVVRNGQDDFWEREKRARLMNRETGVPSMRRGVRACFSCPTGCMPHHVLPNAGPGPERGEGFWVNTINGYACRLDIDDPQAVLRAWLLTNDLGLDGDYCASILSWVFECRQKGYLSPADLGGLEQGWGDGRALPRLLDDLAHRRHVFAQIGGDLADAVKGLHPEAARLLFHYKGQPNLEPFRIPKAWALAAATSPVGGRHLRGMTCGGAGFGPHPRPNRWGIETYEHQPEGVHWQGLARELEDMLGVCIYPGTWGPASFQRVNDYADLVAAATGLPVDMDRLMEYYGPRGRMMELAFNALNTDFSRRDDYPIDRAFTEPTPRGPHAGQVLDREKFDAMLDEFYTLWGLDPASGRLKGETLEGLDLGWVADKLRHSGYDLL